MRNEFIYVLENEYNILRSLDSPYVVRCLGKDCTVENGVEVCNLWMEYMPGGRVGDLVANFGGRLDESMIRAYTRCLVRGIEYLHGQGILHCDIKGKNVLVGTCGVKLADFGSAKRVKDGGSGIRESFQLRGTPLWMAPEVVNQVEQGPASDIWSLGCTVVEMATGRPPWNDVSNPLAAIYRIGCTDELPELPQCISPQGRDFLEKCFRRDPQQRWTAAQLLNHPFLDGHGCSDKEVKRAPLSPTSTLDSGHPDLKSCSSSLFVTLLILALDTATPARKPEAKEENKSIEQYCSPMSSPRDRVLALAVGGEMPNWFASPPSGQWIIARSSSSTVPTSNRFSSTNAEYDSGSAASVDYTSQSSPRGL